MAKKQTEQKSTAKIIVILILSVLFIAATTLGVIVLIKQMQLKHDDEQNNARDINTADSPLQTPEDLKDENKVAESSNDAKDRMEADERTKTVVDKDESGLNIAKPIVNFVTEEDGGLIAAGGAIPNINEEGGTCTYVFVKGDTNITASTGVLPNPSYISCETVRIEKSKFTSGVWSVKIQYKSKTSEGESEAQSYTIQ